MNDTRRKLALVCGMFGSAHVGERAAAALKAPEIVASLRVLRARYSHRPYLRLQELSRQDYRHARCLLMTRSGLFCFSRARLFRYWTNTLKVDSTG